MPVNPEAGHGGPVDIGGKLLGKPWQMLIRDHVHHVDLGAPCKLPQERPDDEVAHPYAIGNQNAGARRLRGAARQTAVSISAIV